MKTVRTVSIVLVVLIIGGSLLVNALHMNVPAGMVGVRTQQYALLGEKGVVEKDFGPGWHRDLGPVDSWVTFDSTVQTLEMTRDPGRGARRGRDDVQVQSADGYSVSVDVTVKYQIMKGAAHKLYQNTGGKDAYKRIVRNEAEKAAIAELGTMKTEDFYNPTARRANAKRAHRELQESLRDNYVEVIDLLIRNVRFDAEYEKKIRDKKLADQRVEVNQAETRATEMRGKTQVIQAETKREVKVIQEQKAAEIRTLEAETDRKIATIKANAGKYAQQKRADADATAEKLIAEGNLQVKQAEAEGERLRNKAMMGTGGDILVALEAAKNLQLNTVSLSTLQTDLLDLDGMARKLGVPAEATGD